jgi:tetratricopeptide (TPR) repeat protein
LGPRAAQLLRAGLALGLVMGCARPAPPPRAASAPDPAALSWAVVAGLEEEQGRLDRALDAWARVSLFDPRAGYPHLARARLLLQQGCAEQARAELERAARDPQLPVELLDALRARLAAPLPSPSSACEP